MELWIDKIKNNKVIKRQYLTGMKEVDYFMNIECGPQSDPIIWREEKWGNWVEVDDYRFELRYKE